MKLLRCIFLFSLGSCASLYATSTSYFYGDSYAGDTRYTVTKLFDGNDDTLCWAASASSILYYWQNSYSAYLPAGTPNGQHGQSLYSNNIFYTFTNSFVDSGGIAIDAFSWWLTGKPYLFNYEYKTGPLASLGGYYADWNWQISDIGTVESVSDNATQLGSLLQQANQNDWLMTLTVGKDGAELNHAVALWGYEIDTTLDMITGLWISDSDSTDIDSNFLVPVAWDDSAARWEIPEGTFESWHLVRVNIFYAPAIPEPRYAATLLLVGAAFVAVRLRHGRHRNKA